MEPIVKEKETIYADGYGGNGGGSNLRSKANAGVTLGIIGTVLGAAAIAKQGGVGGILGGGVATPTPDGPVNNFYGAFAPSVRILRNAMMSSRSLMPSGLRRWTP